MKLTKILTGALALLVCSASLSLYSCGGEKTESVKEVDAVKAKGKLVVGITEYEPMDYQDENGKWIGFDAEFAEMFAANLGIEAEFVVIDWDNKLFELSSGAIDCIWNGMTITPEITESCAVSNAYVKNQQVVVMAADQLANYTTVESLASLTFAAEAGSAGESAINDAIAGANCTAVAAQSDALLEVASGSVNACVIDVTMAEAMTGEGTSYADLGIGLALTSEEYGVAFRKGSDLCESFNSYMTAAVADGSLKTLAEKYNLSLAQQ